MIKRSLTLLLSGLLWAGLAFGQININTASPEELDGLKGIGPATLEFELVYWVTSPDYGHYMDVQQRVNLAVLRTVRAQGLEIAPPARAVHLVGPTPQ